MSSRLRAHDAEQKILHLCTSIPELAPKALARLTDDHFDRPDFRAAWRALRELVTSGAKVSPFALYRAVKAQGGSGDVVLEMLKEPLPGFMADDFEPAAQALEIAEARRRMHRAADAIRKMAEGKDMPDAVSVEVMAQAEVWNALRTSGRAGTITIGEAAERVLHEWEMAEQGQGPPRTATGYRRTLDRALGGGFAPGDLTILAGRPHMGKTAFALCTSLAAARTEGQRVLYFSPEMDEYALASRAFQTFGITTEQVITPDADTIEQARGILRHLQSARIHIDPRRSLTVDDIIARSLAFTMEHPDTKLIVIDHLQQITIPSGERNFVKAVGEVCRRLRDMAGELNVPVVLLSQLNRGLESRDDKRPRMSDVRDSGEIEEHADVMLFLYREIVYNDDFPEDLHNVCELIVGKNRRTGRLGTLYLEFHPAYIRFQDGDPETLLRYRQYMDARDAARQERGRSRVRRFGREAG